MCVSLHLPFCAVRLLQNKHIKTALYCHVAMFALPAD
uniref:Uncharacterized protein n=1 Tax=Anguilla anguilla TaxID=7936 RepID=A0A0E9QAA6_ANGAN